MQYRRVTTGALQEDGLRVITEGLKPDDWVVVGGLQQVRPHMKIQPEHSADAVAGPSPPARSDRPPSKAEADAGQGAGKPARRKR